MTPKNQPPRNGKPKSAGDIIPVEHAEIIPPDLFLRSDAQDDDFDSLFDDFAAKTRTATASPTPDAKAAHLRLAQENFAALQGAREGMRLNTDPDDRGIWYGVRKMLNVLTTRGALTLTTACLAGGLLVLSPQGQELLRGPIARNAQAPDTQSDTAPQENLKVTAQGTVSMSSGTQEADNITREAGSDVLPPAPDLPVADAAQATSAMTDNAVAQAMNTAPATREMSAPIPRMAEAPLTRVAPAQGMPPAAIAPHPDGVFPLQPDSATWDFANAPESGVVVTADHPVSTFSVDVDTAAWSVMRQSLNMGRLPFPDPIRIEEMVNYFPYDYAAPTADDTAPFATHLALMPTPWNPDTQLLRIGLQGEMPAFDPRPTVNLVFLIDTSGSMDAPDKLPLLQGALLMMLGALDPTDQVAIVTYAGSAGVVLQPTAAEDRTAIIAALDNLQPSGGTAGAAGLAQAYALADSMRGEGEISRVILATDGDFNIGPSDPAELERLIAKARDGGSYLSVLGFGRSNIDDRTMQTLAQNGNGTAAYIDTMAEAQKVLRDQLSAALFPIADDVKVQVEFNPATVAEYRLIGYETRALAREDFNNDRVDAGEIGAGHAVTALYEITPVGSPATLTDPLRYGTAVTGGNTDELGFLRLRWKEPGADDSQLVEMPILADTPADPEAAFAAAIAGFGQILRGGDWTGDWTIRDARALAAEHIGPDPYGYRAEALRLMDLAAALQE